MNLSLSLTLPGRPARGLATLLTALLILGGASLPVSASSQFPPGSPSSGVQPWPERGEPNLVTLQPAALDRFILRSTEALRTRRTFGRIQDWLDTLPTASWLPGPPATPGFFLVWHAPGGALLFGPIPNRDSQRTLARALADTLDLLRRESGDPRFRRVQIIGLSLDDPAQLHQRLADTLELRRQLLPRLDLFQILTPTNASPRPDPNLPRAAAALESAALGGPSPDIAGNVLLPIADLHRLATEVCLQTLQRGAPAGFTTTGLDQLAGPPLRQLLPSLAQWLATGAQRSGLNPVRVPALTAPWLQNRDQLSPAEFQQLLLQTGLRLLAFASESLGAGSLALALPSVDPALLSQLARQFRIDPQSLAHLALPELPPPTSPSPLPSSAPDAPVPPRTPLPNEPLPLPVGLLDSVPNPPTSLPATPDAPTHTLAIHLGQQLLRNAGLTIEPSDAVTSPDGASVASFLQRAWASQPDSLRLALQALRRVDPTFVQSHLAPESARLMAAALGNAHLRESLAQRHLERHAPTPEAQPQPVPLGPAAAVDFTRAIAQQIDAALAPKQSPTPSTPSAPPSAPTREFLVQALERALSDNAVQLAPALSSNLVHATPDPASQLQDEARHLHLDPADTAALSPSSLTRRLAEARADQLLSGEFSDNLTRAEVAELAAAAEWNTLKSEAAQSSQPAAREAAVRSLDRILAGPTTAPAPPATSATPGSTPPEATATTATTASSAADAASATSEARESKASDDSESGSGNGGSSSWLSGPLAFKMPMIEFAFRMLAKYLGVEELAQLLAPVMGALVPDALNDVFKAFEALNNAFGKDLNAFAQAANEFLNKFGKFIDAADGLMADLATKSIADLTQEKLTDYVRDRIEEQLDEVLDGKLGGTVDEVLHLLREGRLSDQAEARLRRQLVDAAAEKLGLPPEVRNGLRAAADGRLDLHQLQNLGRDAVEARLRQALLDALPENHLAGVVAQIQEMQRVPAGLSSDRLLQHAQGWAESQVAQAAAQHLGLPAAQLSQTLGQIRQGDTQAAAQTLLNSGRRHVLRSLTSALGVADPDRLVQAIETNNPRHLLHTLQSELPALANAAAARAGIDTNLAAQVTRFAAGSQADRRLLARQWQSNAIAVAHRELRSRSQELLGFDPVRTAAQSQRWLNALTNPAPERLLTRLPELARPAGLQLLRNSPLADQAESLVAAVTTGSLAQIQVAAAQGLRQLGESRLEAAGLPLGILQSIASGQASNLIHHLQLLDPARQATVIETLIRRSVAPAEAAALLRAGAVDRAIQLLQPHLASLTDRAWQRSWEIAGQALTFEQLIERSRQGLPLPGSVAALINPTTAAAARDQLIRQLWLTDVARDLLPTGAVHALSLERFNPDPAAAAAQFTAAFAQQARADLERTLGPGITQLLAHADTLLQSGAPTNIVADFAHSLRAEAGQTAARLAPVWLAISALATQPPLQAARAAAEAAFSCPPNALREVLDSLGWLTDETRAALPETWSSVSEAEVWFRQLVQARLHRESRQLPGLHRLPPALLNTILNGDAVVLGETERATLFAAAGLEPALAQALASGNPNALAEDLRARAQAQLRANLGLPETLRLDLEAGPDSLAAWLPSLRTALLSRHLRLPKEHLQTLLNPDHAALTAETARVVLQSLKPSDPAADWARLAPELVRTGADAERLARDLNTFLQAPSLSAARQRLPESPEAFLRDELRHVGDHSALLQAMGSVLDY